MAKTRRLLTSFAKGELSPLLEGRPDLAAYFDGAKTLENFALLRQGGVTRRAGTRFVSEVKDSTKATILLPFEFSVDDAYVIEFGHLYARFYKNGAPVTSAPELVTNGTFPTGISGWTVAQGDITWDAARQAMRLHTDAGTPTSTARQTLTIASAGASHTLRFKVELGNGLILSIGTGAGGNPFADIKAIQLYLPGSHIVAFTPPGATAVLTYEHRLTFGHPDIYLDDVSVQLTTATIVEVITPYTEGDLRSLHFTQSADVLFLFHSLYGQRKLSRVSDTSWTLSTITYTPPPSFEADTDISGATVTLTLAATSGTGVIVTASAAVFLQGDVGRQLIIGPGRAVIVAFGASAGDTASPNDNVRIDILDPFASTGPHAAGTWLLRLSPQATLDPNIKEPIGAQVTLVAGTPTFRAADVGKFIHIYGGVVKVTTFDTASQVKGTIQSALGLAAAADPAAAPAGAWTLEVASWSAARGFPRTGEFFQGRLGQAGTISQPTAWWLSASDSFDNYAVGILADDAVEYTIASRQVNRIEWLGDNLDLFIGTAGAEFRAQGERNGEPLGGDVIPLVERLTPHGCAPIQPVVLSRRTLYVDRSQKKIFLLAFDLAQEGFDAAELTDVAEHITGTGLRTGPLGYRKRPDPTVYFVRTDGQLVALTYLPLQRVIGFTRIVTAGLIEAVAVIPRPAGQPDQVWVIVTRTIGGLTKRYVEYVQEDSVGFARPWASLQTDSAILYNGASTTTITGLSHVNGETVDVIAGASFRGTKVVAGGQITLDEAATEVEVGLHYDSTGVTMRPAIEGQVIEGLPRSWDSLFARLKDTIGGTINGEKIQYVPSDLDTKGLFTGDRKVSGVGWDTEGRITVQQTQPYPMTLLAVFGTLSVGDHD